jgi:hypothetical protein
MITKAELEAASREALAAPHEAPDEPPTVDELTDWADGKLSPEEAERVARRAARYPELARAALATFDDVPADAAGMTEEEQARQWEAMKRRLPVTPAPEVLPFPAPQPLPQPQWWRTAAIAASVSTVILAGVAVREHAGAREGALVARALAPEVVLPGKTRGPGEAVRRLTADLTLLHPQLTESQLRYSEYRVDVVDRTAQPERVLSSVSGLQPRHRELDVLISRAALTPGHEYAIVVYGLTGPEATSLASYPFRP